MDISKILPNFDISQISKKIVDKVKKSNEYTFLGDRQKLVYESLANYNNGATAKELSVALYNQGLVAFNERNSVHPRLNELISSGLVETVGKKKCQFTDRSVTVYKIKLK